jgi:undecaprenyl-diphosphatase
MTLIQIIILAVIQGLAELLPVSSSAHVIVAKKLMGIDPTAPEMTFFIVMLHTGTMFAAIAYFGKRWLQLLSWHFVKMITIATAVTGVVGFGLKMIVEAVMTRLMFPDGGMAAGSALESGKAVQAHVEIEQLFGNLPAISVALFCAGLLILYSSRHEGRAKDTQLTNRSATWIGVIQGFCIPFRGFSRSGATISVGMVAGVERRLAEEFSFALAVVLTPVAIARTLWRLHKMTGEFHSSAITPGLIGMGFAFLAGLAALRWLSNWLENGKWHYFGYYCLFFSGCVATLAAMGY